jgi:DAACS family dicarboxylate/amino acid:cation (Na+ or H+) symporter
VDGSWLEWPLRYLIEPFGKIFIRLLLMLVVPLVFAALVVGVCELDLRQLGRLGARTLGYTLVVSFIAVVIGLSLVTVLQPGRTISEATRAAVSTQIAPASLGGGTALDLLINIVPINPVAAAANGDMLGFIFFGVLFGVGLSQVSSEGAQVLRRSMQGLLDVSMRLIELVLRLAPYGIFALMLTMTTRLGLDALIQLGAYVGVVVLGLALQMFGVYSLSVRFLGGLQPSRFFRAVRLAMVTAFSTASSSATLPTALRVADEQLGLPPRVSRFVLTAGATMNQNGTALFEGVTVLFLAQAYGVELSLAQQGVVMLICVLAGIGTAGVPAGSLPVIAAIVTLFGIPAESIGLILGVDRLLDMCRTTVNVTGDLAAAVFVARGEERRPSGASDGSA